jgi:hypothetical protein
MALPVGRDGGQGQPGNRPAQPWPISLRSRIHFPARRAQGGIPVVRRIQAGFPPGDASPGRPILDSRSNRRSAGPGARRLPLRTGSCHLAGWLGRRVGQPSSSVADRSDPGIAQLRAALRQRAIGQLTLKKRGSAVEASDFARRLKLKGDRPATLLMTRVLGRPQALLIELLAPTGQAPPQPSGQVIWGS